MFRVLYSSFIQNGRYLEISDVLEDIRIDEVSDDLLINLLAAIYPSRRSVSSYNYFFTKVERCLEARYKSQEAFLSDLKRLRDELERRRIENLEPRNLVP